jgi:hypothetical protein
MSSESERVLDSVPEVTVAASSSHSTAGRHGEVPTSENDRYVAFGGLWRLRRKNLMTARESP